MKNLPTKLLRVISALLVTCSAPAWAEDVIAQPARVIDLGEGGAARRQQAIDAQVELGLAYLRAQRYVDAARELTAALKMGTPSVMSKADVQVALDEAKRHVGTLRIRLTESDVDLTIDGNPITEWGTLPEEVVYLWPGRYRIGATKEGFASFDDTIELKAGEDREIMIPLDREGQELYRKQHGIPTRVQMSFGASAAPPPEAPTWPGKLLLGSGVGLGISAAMIVTGVVLTTPEAPNWRGVTIGGGVLGGLSLTGIVVAAYGWATRTTPPPVINVQPVVNGQQTGVNVTGSW